jgi:hypothetical protein
MSLSQMQLSMAAAGFDLVEFIKYAGTAGFAVMPFLAYWAMLKWNFRVGSTGYGKAFNLVGALFSTILYSFYAFTAPNKSLLLTNLYFFFVPAVVCTVLYFALFLLLGESVAAGKHRWVIVVAMFQYIVVLCIFAVLCTIVLKHKEFYLVGGRVTMGGQPIPDLVVTWKFKPFAPSPSTEGGEINLRNQTDDAGRYLISLEWAKMPAWKAEDLDPVLLVHAPRAEVYQQPLDKANQVPWNIKL